MVDQVEDIQSLSGGAFPEQIKGWRTLHDEATNALGLLFGMDGTSEDIEPIMTDALYRRMTMPPISLKTLQPDECKSLLLGVMKVFRRNGSTLPDNYPFTSDGLMEVVNRTAEKLPSYLLNNCRQVFSKVARNNNVQSTSEFIDESLVSTYLSST